MAIILDHIFIEAQKVRIKEYNTLSNTLSDCVFFENEHINECSLRTFFAEYLGKEDLRITATCIYLWSKRSLEYWEISIHTNTNSMFIVSPA